MVLYVASFARSKPVVLTPDVRMHIHMMDYTHKVTAFTIAGWELSACRLRLFKFLCVKERGSWYWLSPAVLLIPYVIAIWVLRAPKVTWRICCPLAGFGAFRR